MDLKPAQKTAVDFITSNPKSFLVADTGVGKTLIALTAIKHYITAGTVPQAIVVAPASVITHWARENDKFGLGLTVATLTGNAEARLNAMRSKPQVLVVSFNNLDWLLSIAPPAQMIVIDELSKAAGKQCSKLKHKRWIAQLHIRVGLTATPVSENFIKLQGMTRVLDNGAALGRSKEAFLFRYFNQMDYKGYRFELKQGADLAIVEALQPLLHVIKSDKVATLPEMSQVVRQFTMPDATREHYKTMQRDMLFATESGVAIAPNLAVVSAKCRQLASGFIILEDETVEDFDSARADAAMDWVANLQGKPGVILYQYNYQLQQLKEALGARYNCAYVFGGSDKEAALTAFKAGAVQILIAQENTLSHGVDGLQHVCADLCFYQLPWSGDTKLQAIGRVFRQGQKNPVTITTLECKNTVDGIVKARHSDKGEFMKLFLNHLKELD